MKPSTQAQWGFCTQDQVLLNRDHYLQCKRCIDKIGYCFTQRTLLANQELPGWDWDVEMNHLIKQYYRTQKLNRILYDQERKKET